MTKRHSFLTEEEIKACLILAREDLIDFSIVVSSKYSATWFHEEVAKQLMAVERGEIRRLMIFCPPRHGKSQIASINFPAWYLGRNPDKEIITASYSGELAQDFGYKTRDLVNDDIYHKIFNLRLKEDSKSKAKWMTNKNGSYTSVGVGGAITGRGANILLIDDPLKNREEAESKVVRDKIYSWYTSTAYTRLEKDGAIVLIMTRWHLDDLAGKILDNDNESWQIVEFPAIAEKDEKYRKIGEPLWPDKYDLKALEDIKRNIGIYDFSALYQQNPIPTESQDFRKNYFRYFEEEEIKDKQLQYYITVDLAIGQKEQNDNTAIIVVGKERVGANWYIIEKNIGRLTPLEVIDELFALYLKYRPIKIGIETVAYQEALVYFLTAEMKKRQIYLPIQELKPKSDKELRIRGLIPLYKTGVIWHRHSDIDLEEELLTFPKGKHDDIIDALSYQLYIQNIPTYHDNKDLLRKKLRNLRQQSKNHKMFKMV